MSHFTTWQTTLKDVTEQMVKDAVTELAKELGATIITNIHNAYEMSNQAVLIGLTMAGLPNGIGVRIEGGQLVICGDPYSQNAAYERLTKLIPNYAKIYQVKQKAKNNPKVLGMTTKIKGKEIELRIRYREVA